MAFNETPSFPWPSLMALGGAAGIPNPGMPVAEVLSKARMIVFYHLAPGPWLSILLAIGTSSILMFIQRLDAISFRSTRKEMLENQQAWQSAVFDPTKVSLGQWFMDFDVTQKKYEWAVTMQTIHLPSHVPWIVPPDTEWDQLGLGITNRCSTSMRHHQLRISGYLGGSRCLLPYFARCSCHVGCART
jgi:hypothetical protein